MPPDASEDGEQPSDEQTEHILTEGRMVLPGLLSIIGFQIIAVFNPVFHDRLLPFERGLHVGALLLLAVGLALVLTPAAYHRQVDPYRTPPRLPGLATLCFSAAMAPLMLALAIDVYLVSRVAIDECTIAVVLAAVVLMMFCALWFVVPQLARRRRDRD